MKYEVVMPQLGLTMEEGTVVSWKKQTGDHVEKGEVLFTVETDKAQMDVESLDTGYLIAMLANEGTKVAVGTVIALLSDQPQDADSAATVTRPESAELSDALPECNSNLATQASIRASKRPDALYTPIEYAASPRARRLAQELGIALRDVRPARGKRVVEEDVRRFYQSGKLAPGHTQTGRSDSQGDSPSPARTITAQRTAESFRSAFHFYLGIEVNAKQLVRVREQLRAASDLHVTYTDLFLRAMAVALKERPQVNVYWHEHRPRSRDTVDIGFAVNTQIGLLVPVVREADRLPLLKLAFERQRLTEKARGGTLSLTEMEGGSATLSNLGGFGVDWFQAILNPPQSVILAAGRIVSRAVVVDDSVQVCPTLMLSLSVDHRVLDGAAGAGFLVRIKDLIENPSVML